MKKFRLFFFFFAFTQIEFILIGIEKAFIITKNNLSIRKFRNGISISLVLERANRDAYHFNRNHIDFIHTQILNLLIHQFETLKLDGKEKKNSGKSNENL